MLEHTDPRLLNTQQPLFVCSNKGSDLYVGDELYDLCSAVMKAAFGRDTASCHSGYSYGGMVSHSSIN